MVDNTLFICFCDSHALLNTAADTGIDNNEAMDVASNARKAGFTNDYVVLARLSFDLPLPVVFGKESSKVETRDSRILHGLKTVKSWDDGNQYTGQKTEAETKLRGTEAVLRKFSLNAAGLSDEAQWVAVDCQIRTSNFVTCLVPIKRESRTVGPQTRCGNTYPTAFGKYSIGCTKFGVQVEFPMRSSVGFPTGRKVGGRICGGKIRRSCRVVSRSGSPSSRQNRDERGV